MEAWSYLIVGIVAAGAGVIVERIRVNVRLRLEHEREDAKARRTNYRNMLNCADRMLENGFAPELSEDADIQYDYDSDSYTGDGERAQYANASEAFDDGFQEIETLGARRVLKAAERFREACKRGDKDSARAARLTLREAMRADIAPD